MHCKVINNNNNNNNNNIQTSTRDWNHPVFRAGSLLPEVIIPSKLSDEQQLQLLYSLSSTLTSEILYVTSLVLFNVVPTPRPVTSRDTPIKQAPRLLTGIVIYLLICNQQNPPGA